MIGVFDSGAGGRFALAELRRLSPDADIVFLADEKNAPYGTKGKAELKRLVSADIEALISVGCEKILMACCTASTVWDSLSEKEREISVPIIEPTVLEALRISKNKRIGILSTEATRKSEAFACEILKREPHANIV